VGALYASDPHLEIEGLLTFPWVGERLFHRGNGGQSPASDSIASAISAPALWKP
jgi:hypothetical protein